MAPRHHRANRGDSGPRRRTRGQSLTEFALIFPVFLLMTVGVVDFARIFSSYIALTNAVREGALYAGTCADPTSCGYTDAVKVRLAMDSELVGMNGSDVAVADPLCRGAWPDGTDFATGATKCPTSTDASLQFVRVSASYPVALLTPIVSTMFGGSVHMSASTVAPIIQP